MHKHEKRSLSSHRERKKDMYKSVNTDIISKNKDAVISLRYLKDMIDNRQRSIERDSIAKRKYDISKEIY